MNRFLASLEITFRRDPTNFRPRVNKMNSIKDREQKGTLCRFLFCRPLLLLSGPRSHLFSPSCRKLLLPRGLRDRRKEFRMLNDRIRRTESAWYLSASLPLPSQSSVDEESRLRILK
jgi:hypothetical protein